MEHAHPMTTRVSLILAIALVLSTMIYALASRYTPAHETDYTSVVDRWTGHRRSSFP